MKKIKKLQYYTNDESYDNISGVQEAMEIYTYDINNEHDKIVKDILKDKEEARCFINEYLHLKIPIEKDSLELYSNSYITEAYRSKESDIVYKLQNKNIFFLIEHQSKVDVSMPYRIEKYSMEIIDSAIDKERMYKNGYLYPKVIPIVLYTGNKEWKVKTNFADVQEKLPGYEDNEKTYIIVDINDYNEKNLLQDELLITKIMLLEKCNTNSELIKTAYEILQKISNGYKFDKMVKIIYLFLGKRFGAEEADLIIKNIINEKGDENNMIDVIERIEENERREKAKAKREGKKEGIREGIKEATISIAKKLKLDGMNVEKIIEITGLSKKEITSL